MLTLLLGFGSMGDLRMNWGPPVPVGGGGKMSNTLDLYPSGFATGMGSPVPFSVDGGATFHRARFNQTRNRTFDSFATYTDGNATWGHGFGTVGEVLKPSTPTATSLESQPTMTYRFVDGELTEALGPPVQFRGLPEPICHPPKTDPTFYFTLYASGHVQLANGTHLQTGMYSACPGPKYVRDNGIHLFSSADGYSYQFVGHVARQSDRREWAYPAEGPNEHTMVLLGNGSLYTVFRTQAGDGNGRYGPFYSTVICAITI